MQALVQDSREKPSSAIDVAGSSANQGITTDQMRVHVASEVELLSSDDLITQLVQYRCKILHIQPPEPGGNQMYSAAKSIRSHLSIEPVRNTSILGISYRDRNPELAQRLLQELQRLYVAKHLQTLRPAGASLSFASRETAINDELSAKERALADLRISNDYVTLDGKKNELEQLQSALQKTLLDATVAEQAHTAHLKAVEALLRETPQRIATTTRLLSNSTAIQQITVSLLDLKNKRTLLASRYQPSEPSLRDLDKQITTSELTLQELKRLPPDESTTDINPVWVQLQSDYNQALANAASDKALIRALNQQKVALGAQSAHLQEVGLINGQLERTINDLKQSQKEYAQKRLDEQLQDALDRQQVGNVFFTMAPTFSRHYVSPNILLNILIGFTIAVFLAIAIVLFLESTRSTLNTPAEVEAIAGVPVLVTIPESPSIPRWQQGRPLQAL